MLNLTRNDVTRMAFVDYCARNDVIIKKLLLYLGPRDGFLKCSEQLQFCQAKNLWVDFRDLISRKHELLRYNTDVLKRGQIRARCEFNSPRLKSEMIHLGPLQSWGAELQNFEALDKNEIVPCDVRIEKPTFFMKIDATVNMYHHFCDFFNLYASLHINGSILPNTNTNHFDEEENFRDIGFTKNNNDENTNNFDTFNRDINIAIWENVRYQSAFSQVFNAFTYNPILNLNTFAGKRGNFQFHEKNHLY